MKYFKEKTWSEVSCEKEFFCAELFCEIRINPQAFIELCGLPPKNYDIGFKVGLLRDIFKLNDRNIKEWSLPRKRTFDIVLFSEDEIIILETSLKKQFKEKKLAAIRKDVDSIRGLCMHLSIPRLSVLHFAICSSRYRPLEATLKDFNKVISWANLAIAYPDKEAVFNRAESLYDKNVLHVVTAETLLKENDVDVDCDG